MPRTHDIRRLLLATLTATPLAGCPSTWNCNPDSRSFDGTYDVTREMLVEYGVVPGETPDDEACRSACKAAYRGATGWEVTEQSACSLALEDGAGDSGEGRDVVGEVTCSGTAIEYWCEGRRPLGHVEASAHGPTGLARDLAALAHLEAASVNAFSQLAGWLEGRGAAALAARCRVAAEDERNHARWLTAVAERLGASVPAPHQEPAPDDLLAVALHNAVEGCVHETWAALEAEVAAGRATDPAMRTLWARIAHDEAAHAQLAWDLHAWLGARLSEGERRRVEEAQAQALTALPARARHVARGAHAALGFPDEALAEALATDLTRRLAA